MIKKRNKLYNNRLIFTNKKLNITLIPLIIYKFNNNINKKYY